MKKALSVMALAALFCAGCEPGEDNDTTINVGGDYIQASDDSTSSKDQSESKVLGTTTTTRIGGQ